MPCYRPLLAYQCANGAVVFSELKRNEIHKQILLACGQCVGCRLERSRQWAARCVHEAQLHKYNAFITLTYKPEKLQSPSLRHRDYQLFMKRTRKLLSTSSNKLLTEVDRMSYYMAGEYGTNHGRPHFHACLFGIDMADKKHWKKTASGSRLYTSETLDQLWQHQGFTSLGEVTFESAAYIARYIMSKQTGPGAWKYYEHIDEETGVITDLQPEYNRMSLNPAIGKRWLQKYGADAYPEGQILIRGHKATTPKYYDKQYKKENPDQYEEMKMKRELQALEYRQDNTPERLKAKETVTKAKIKQLIRTIN